jgi:hypothetical protein
MKHRVGSVDPTAVLSDQLPHHLEKRERCAMAGTGFRSLPRENPCAQCGRSIALPEWVETEPGRTFYLWRCMACDYHFEAVAYFDEDVEIESIAA